MHNDSLSEQGIFSKQYISALLLVCVAVLLHAADATLVATLIPAIVDEIGGIHLIPWATSLYEVGSITAGAASGLLATRHGIKIPMLISALIFSTGCFISALAPEMWLLLMGRLIQGLGGGGLTALSFVAVSLLFPKKFIPQALAAVSVVWGTSAFLGPLVGGVFAEFASWRFAFAFFSVLALLLAFWILIKVQGFSATKETEHQRFPLIRLTLLSCGVICIAYAGADISLISTPLFVMLGVIFLAYFLHIDSKHETSRLLPRHPITLNNPVSAGLTMILCFTIATIALSVYGPFFLIKIHGISVLLAGYIVACSAVGWSLAAFMFAKVSEKFDRRMIILGMVVLTISIVGFVFSIPGGPLWLIVVFAFIEGIGFGMSWAFILRLATTMVDPKEKQRLSAAMPTVQRSGYAIGAAYIGIAANAAGLESNDDTVNYASAAFWVFVACLPFALIGLIAAFKFTKTN